MSAYKIISGGVLRLQLLFPFLFLGGFIVDNFGMEPYVERLYDVSIDYVR